MNDLFLDADWKFNPNKIDDPVEYHELFRERRAARRRWDTLVQRALACGVGAFVLALLVVLWVTR